MIEIAIVGSAGGNILKRVVVEVDRMEEVEKTREERRSSLMGDPFLNLGLCNVNAKGLEVNTRQLKVAKMVVMMVGKYRLIEMMSSFDSIAASWEHEGQQEKSDEMVVFAQMVYQK